MAIAREAGPVGSLHEVREAGLDREDLLGIYRNMLVTRGIEERGHILYRQGKIPGSFYTGRGTVLDVCPLSNLRTGVVASLEEHPLPQLVAAGVRCSISTDDPAMFDTDLTRDYEAAASLGVSPRAAYEAGVAGALCDEATRERLRLIGEQHVWDR